MGSRYISLSYCWPIDDTFKLTKADLTELIKIYSLQQRMHEIPQSVHDAIHCAVNLGERYLEVDALCIIQDSVDHKRIQIAQINRIYEAAISTLVTAPSATTDACNGLPCYRENSEDTDQDIELVQGLHLAVPLNAIPVTIMFSTWDNRAWTYQEVLLSR